MAKINYREQYAQYSRYFTKILDTVNQKPIVKESIKLVLSLFTISFLLVFALRPTINTIAELLANVRLQKETTLRLDEKIQNLQKARQIWNQEQDKILLVEQTLPSDAKPENLLQQIEGLVAAHNLSLTGFNIEDVNIIGKEKAEQTTNPNSKPGFAGTKNIKFSLIADGSYENLFSFLQELDNLRIAIILDSFSLTQGKTGGNNLLSLKLVGTIPYLLKQ